MQVLVDDVELFFDVDGAKLVPDGSRMREKPTVLLLHGGPGFDHTHYKPLFSSLTDVAQLVYIDHRGNGRSGRGSKEKWNLQAWGRDVAQFCDKLGIERPIVLGSSFGGFVAQAFATMFPERLSKLILMSTTAYNRPEVGLALFERFGGDVARKAAQTMMDAASLEAMQQFSEHCYRFYSRDGLSPDIPARSIINMDVLMHYHDPRRSEWKSMDFRAALANLSVPVLILNGELDPVTPLELAREMAASLTHAPVRFEQFDGCYHDLANDDPERVVRVVREFIQR